MIVVTDDQGYVMAYGISAERVDAQGETGLVKVNISEDAFYYLGNINRDDFIFHDVTDLPDEMDKPMKYSPDTGFYELPEQNLP